MPATSEIIPLFNIGESVGACIKNFKATALALAQSWDRRAIGSTISFRERTALTVKNLPQTLTCVYVAMTDMHIFQKRLEFSD